MPKALLVCDTPWVVNEVLSSLSLGGWEVETTDDPTQAATKAAEGGVDVVIIDLQVQSMGGMAVIRDIRAAFQIGPRPRTVLLLDRSADSFLAKRARADAWVIKPFQDAELRAALAV
ncbi:MAG TPA: response regulator [Acidimicrobiia bacterium]|nr:response regulator [Acidimicrobiia bacterium]